MGYFKGMGPIVEAEMQNGVLIVHKPNGTLKEYKTALKVTLPFQINKFSAVEVTWVLFNEDNTKIYVGRQSGTIGVYTYPDFLFIGSSTWDCPTREAFERVGVYRPYGGKQTFLVYVDHEDYRTCYMQHIHDKCFVANEHLAFDISLPGAYAQTVLCKPGLHIFKKGVDIGDEGSWYLQDDIIFRNVCKFL